MTAYAISLLTNRSFIIDLSKPCNLQDIIIPNEVEWTLSSLPKKEGFTKHHLLLHWDFDFVRNHLMKINFLKYYNQKNVIVVRTGLNLVQHLSVNRKHHKKIKSLGYAVEKFNIENLLFQWYRNLFKFKEDFQEHFNKVLKKAKPNKHTKLICAQIRIGMKGDMQFTKRNNTKLFWNLIKEKFLSDNNIKENFKIFITTDIEDVIDEAIYEFSEEKVVAFKNRSIHFEMAKETQCNSLNGVYLDFNLLGECDMGVISHSGFGFMGILRRKNIDTLKKNFYVYTNPDDLTKNFGKRSNLSFIPFDVSLLYLENKLHNVTY